MASAFGTQHGLAAMLAPMLLAGMAIFVIFRVYADSLSNEFYEMAKEYMNDYALTQRAEAQSSMRKISTTITTMRALAESPDFDPEGDTFQKYLETWNERGTFQVAYASVESLESSLGDDAAGDDAAETLEKLKAGESVVSDVRKSERLGGYYYSIAEPVVRDGRVVGVLRSISSADNLLQSMQSNSQVSLIGALLVKEDGAVVTSSLSNEEEIDGRSLYTLLREEGVTDDVVESVRASIENDGESTTYVLGKSGGRTSFVTTVGLGIDDWIIVTFTEESLMADHSRALMADTVVTGALLVFVSALVFLAVALVVGRIRRGARREAERYAALSEFSDTVLFEYSYPSDTLAITPNARSVFPLEKLVWNRYLERGEPFLEIEGQDRSPLDLLGHPGPAETARRIVCRARAVDGKFRWFAFKCRYLYDGSTLYAAVGSIADITQQKLEEDKLRRRSQIDGLTRALNKITATEAIAERLDKEDRGMLFVLDVDEFKQVNDSYGHSTGDRVLEQVVQLLFSAFRAEDVVGRVGGDEFVVFVSGVDDEELAETKRAAVEKSVCELASKLEVPVSVSVGVALSPRDGATYQELFDAADAAMYGRKHDKNS